MKKTKLGALWLKEGQYGKFMTGEVEMGGQKVRITVSKNRFKDSDKHPDYVIFEDTYKKAEAYEGSVADDEDIPF